MPLVDRVEIIQGVLVSVAVCPIWLGLSVSAIVLNRSVESLGAVEVHTP